MLPGPIRRQLGLRIGDQLDIDVEQGRVVLTPNKPTAHKTRIVIDPVTGLPALTAGPDAPTLTNKQIREILATFP